MPLIHQDSWFAASYLLHERFITHHQNGATVWADMFEPFVPWITFIQANEKAHSTTWRNSTDRKLRFHRNGGHKVHTISTRKIVNGIRLECFLCHRTAEQIVTRNASSLQHHCIRYLWHKTRLHVVSNSLSACITTSIV